MSASPQNQRRGPDPSVPGSPGEALRSLGRQGSIKEPSPWMVCHCETDSVPMRPRWQAAEPAAFQALPRLLTSPPARRIKCNAALVAGGVGNGSLCEGLGQEITDTLCCGQAAFPASVSPDTPSLDYPYGGLVAQASCLCCQFHRLEACSTAFVNNPGQHSHAQTEHLGGGMSPPDRAGGLG